MSGGTCIAAINFSDDELMASSSGGAFSIIARSALERGGVVYGHAFSVPTKVECVRVGALEDMPRLRGSKYVQSDMGISMRAVLDDLRAGHHVVFSGTPCQVAGLKAFLAAKGVETGRLLLVDIVCHGVPSPLLFSDCMEWERRGGYLEEVHFRDKREGWGCGGGSIVTVTDSPTCGRIVHNRPFSPETSYYYKRFLAGDVYRESCYRCPYAGGTRPGDITIGDFWGIDHEAAGLSPRKGISLVIASTVKGEAAVASIKECARWVERPLEEAVAGNDQLRHPTPRPVARDKTLEEWRTRGISELEARYWRKTAWSRCVWLAKRAIKRFLKGALSR